MDWGVVDEVKHFIDAFLLILSTVLYWPSDSLCLFLTSLFEFFSG